MSSGVRRTEAEILAGLSIVAMSPADDGVHDAIVIRPASELRQGLRRFRLSPEGGVYAKVIEADNVCVGDRIMKL